MYATPMDDVMTMTVFKNDTEKSISVLIEPWADEFIVEPASELEVHVVADTWGRIFTVSTLDHVALWLWSGCRARVYREGREVTANSFALPVP